MEHCPKLPHSKAKTVCRTATPFVTFYFINLKDNKCVPFLSYFAQAKGREKEHVNSRRKRPQWSSICQPKCNTTTPSLPTTCRLDRADLALGAIYTHPTHIMHSAQSLVCVATKLKHAVTPSSHHNSNIYTQLPYFMHTVTSIDRESWSHLALL